MKKIVLGLTVTALALGALVAPSAAVAADLSAADIIAALTANPALLVQLQALLGGSTATAPVSTTFTRDLTIGSTGADVQALQQLLNSKGFTVAASGAGSPGNESMYFGGLTKSALAKWQAANGVAPAAGYFGPLTRSALAAMGGSMTGTGTTGTTDAGCTAGALYSSTTGQPCSTGTTGGTTQGTEGSITTKLSPTPTDNANVRSQNDVPVYGIEVEAVNSDMTVDRLDLQTSVTPTGGSAENPGIFIRTVKVWDGSTLLKEVAIDTSTFSKDSSDRYHVIVSGIGFKVSKGNKRVLTVSFSVNSISSTDVNRAVTVQGYVGNTQNIRAVDTLGLNQYSDMSGSANTRSHTFKPAGASTLTVTINNSLTPDSTNHKVSSTNGVTKMMMLGFNAKAETGDAKITKIYASTSATSSAGYPSTLYLCDGSDTACASPLGSASAGATTGTILFNSLSINVPQDTTKSFFIAGDWPTTSGGQAASTTLPANAVQWEKPDGSTASTSNTGVLTSNDQYMFPSTHKLTLLSTDVTSNTESGSTVSTTTLTFTMKVRVTADGGTIVKPVLGDFTLRAASSTQTTYSAANSITLSSGSATGPISLTSVSPSDTTVGDGGYYDLIFTGNLKNRTAAGALYPTDGYGNYFMVLTSASSSVGGVTTTQTWGLDDFVTGSTLLPN